MKKIFTNFAIPGGRGDIKLVKKFKKRFKFIDESYNASPVAVAAAIETLGAAEVEKAGRRSAVLGDMLEMGPASPGLHADLAPALVSAGADLVFACGPSMANLFEALPGHMRGCYESTSADLLPRVIATVQAGDTVLVKGSEGYVYQPPKENPGKDADKCATNGSITVTGYALTGYPIGLDRSGPLGGGLFVVGLILLVLGFRKKKAPVPDAPECANPASSATTPSLGQDTGSVSK